MPGHSALAVDEAVFTFENMIPSVTKAAVSVVFPAGARWIKTGSGWKEANLGTYVLDNAFRPIIFQDITKSVDSAKIVGYVKGSKDGGDLYGPDGVCSTHTSNAIAAALRTGRFNPRGLDTPNKVYLEVEKLSLASSTTVKWAKPKSKGEDFYKKVLEVTSSDYPLIYEMDDFPKPDGAGDYPSSNANNRQGAYG